MAPRARASQLLPVASRLALVASATPVVFVANEVFVTTVQSFWPTPGLLGLPRRMLPTAKGPCGPVTTQFVPFRKLVVRMPGISTVVLTGQVKTLVPYLPRLVTLQIVAISQSESGRL